jgi:hypothetical protein
MATQIWHKTLPVLVASKTSPIPYLAIIAGRIRQSQGFTRQRSVPVRGKPTHWPWSFLGICSYVMAPGYERGFGF